MNNDQLAAYLTAITDRLGHEIDLVENELTDDQIDGLRGLYLSLQSQIAILTVGKLDIKLG